MLFMLPLMGALASHAGAAAAAGAGAGAAGLGAAAAKGAAGTAGSGLMAKLFGQEPEPPKPAYHVQTPLMPMGEGNPFENYIGGFGQLQRKIRILRPGGRGSNFIDPGFAQALGG